MIEQRDLMGLRNQLIGNLGSSRSPPSTTPTELKRMPTPSYRGLTLGACADSVSVMTGRQWNPGQRCPLAIDLLASERGL